MSVAPLRADAAAPRSAPAPRANGGDGEHGGAFGLLLGGGTATTSTAARETAGKTGTEASTPDTEAGDTGEPVAADGARQEPARPTNPDDVDSTAAREATDGAEAAALTPPQTADDGGGAGVGPRAAERAGGSAAAVADRRGSDAARPHSPPRNEAAVRAIDGATAALRAPASDAVRVPESRERASSELGRTETAELRRAVPPQLARALAEALQRASAMTAPSGTKASEALTRHLAAAARGDGGGIAPLLVQTPPPPPPAVAAAVETAPLPTRSPEVFAQMAARALVDAASDGRWTVTLRLDPPELGRLEVQLAREQGALNASFVAATPASRGLIEQALPLLQQQLNGAGLSLGEVSVSQRDAAGTPDGSGNGDGTDADARSIAQGGTEGDGPFVPASATARRQEGLFDAWA